MNNDMDPRSTDSYEFGEFMATELAKPHIEKRSKKKQLTTEVRRKMSVILDRDMTSNVRENPTEPGIHFEGPGDRRICYVCRQECYGEGYSKKIHNKSPVKTQCISCGKALCTKHRLEICRICANSVAHPPNHPHRAGEPMQD